MTASTIKLHVSCAYCHKTANVDPIMARRHKIATLPNGLPVLVDGTGWRYINGLSFCPQGGPDESSHISAYILRASLGEIAKNGGTISVARRL